MKILVLFDYLTRAYHRKEVKYMFHEDRRIVQELKAAGHQVDTLAFSEQASFKGYDVVFNLCDGFEDDMDFPELTVLKALEKQKVKFTGNSYKTVKLCNDKLALKQRFKQKNIPTAPYQVFRTGKEKRRLPFPLMVKPAKTDAGVGITFNNVVHSDKELRKAVKRCKHFGPVLVAQYLRGREFCVPVMGKKKITVLAPVEMRFGKVYADKPKILSYQTKWAQKDPVADKVYPVPRVKTNRNFSPAMKKQIETLAKKAYQAVGCTGYASVDIRLDENNNPFVLEVNPNCWLGWRSDTSKSARKMGLTYRYVLEKIAKIGKN